MFWGDTNLVFWESLGRSDCTSFSRIGLKISDFANLCLIYFPSKQRFSGRKFFLFTFFGKINPSEKEFLWNLSKFLWISGINNVFRRNLLIWDDWWVICDRFLQKTNLLCKKSFFLHIFGFTQKIRNFLQKKLLFSEIQGNLNKTRRKSLSERLLFPKKIKSKEVPTLELLFWRTINQT